MKDKHKKKLFATIRYSFLQHQELLELSVDPVFEDAKNLIVQGLQMRLGTFEHDKIHELDIIIEPRVKYELTALQA